MFGDPLRRNGSFVLEICQSLRFPTSSVSRQSIERDSLNVRDVAFLRSKACLLRTVGLQKM
jgi:hypothetical protein